MSVLVGDTVVVYSLFAVSPTVCGGCVGSLFCCVVLGAISSLANIYLKRELVALL